MADSPSWPALLERLLQGRPLAAAEASALMAAWLQGLLEPVQTGAFLAALRCRPPDGQALAAMAQELRRVCTLPCELPPMPLVDTCGTGGDGSDSFNISTAVAFTAAACGVTVAKHGNRSASGRVGSADVLERLGLALSAPPQQVVAALPQVGVSFLFAPAWHPAMVNLAGLRRSLGVRTVFNLLGPLVNPLQPQAQVVGVASPELLDPMIEALQHLGLQRGVVVHGQGGLDEASLAGNNALRLLENGVIRSLELSPLQLGLQPAPNSALKGGDPDENAAILEAVLQGGGSDAQRDVVILNTALVLWAAGACASVEAAVPQARNALAAGEPWQRLLALRAALSTAPGG
ncbi:MAG: anthranilate phosphoribosyltransferase [Synechococcaceae cyanobacterium]|nr:anthranilate phosphoribosyltransferase [Synechococcaceae cyanobacterium]